MKSFDYEQSTLADLLILGSFIYLLNVLGCLADRYIYAGLIAQVIIGLIFGPPLTNILSTAWLPLFQDLGNLGLVLLIFHGGLCTRLDLLRANLVLSIIVAIVGVVTPIGLSLIAFIFIFGATPLQAFTAGAALCSTSLGTTFAILSSLRVDIDLRTTRIGTVLLSAAILDDVVGLIMASVVSQVAVQAKIKGTRLAWTILRPIVASGGMAMVTPIVAKWILLPGVRFLYHLIPRLRERGPTLLFIILTLTSFITISNYTGSSMLFGAYSAGCILRFLDVALIEPTSTQSFQSIFKEFLGPMSEHLFVPLFFAVIGTAVPFTSLWKPSILWKGSVYSVFMWLGKAITGLCVFAWRRKELEDVSTITEDLDISLKNMGSAADALASKTSSKESRLRKRPSLFSRTQVYPALFISLAMVSRGEIALLIVQLGRPVLGEELFLIVMWAIIVCTFIGALSTGFLVHRLLPQYVNEGWFLG